jgi:hypothetical protein
MSPEYKIGVNLFPYYVKLEVFRHLSAFTHLSLRETLLDGLVHVQDKYNVNIHAWIVMFSSVKLIMSSPSESLPMEQVADSLLNYTDKKLMNDVSEIRNSIKQKWMMQVFETNRKSHRLVFWHSRYLLTPLATREEFFSRLTDLHESPVRMGIVWDAQHYMYSSAVDYITGEAGLLSVMKLEGYENTSY